MTGLIPLLIIVAISTTIGYLIGHRDGLDQGHLDSWREEILQQAEKDWTGQNNGN